MALIDKDTRRELRRLKRLAMRHPIVIIADLMACIGLMAVVIGFLFFFNMVGGL